MRGTTTSTAMHMKDVSGRKRPATSGNKNTNATAKRKSAMSQTKGDMVGRSLKGPDRGDG